MNKRERDALVLMADLARDNGIVIWDADGYVPAEAIGRRVTVGNLFERGMVDGIDRWDGPRGGRRRYLRLTERGKRYADRYAWEGS